MKEARIQAILMLSPQRLSTIKIKPVLEKILEFNGIQCFVSLRK